MADVSTSELVTLHLGNYRPGDSAAVAPYERSTLGISDALGLDDTLSGRVELLTTLTEMKDEGLVVEDRAGVESLQGARNVYRLTDEGHRRARDIRTRLEGKSVEVVQDGDTTGVRLDALDEELPEVTLVEALARATDDGVIHLGGESQTPEGIVDRQAEFASLRDRIEAVRAGTSETVLVAGESGIGKTTLVEHALEEEGGSDFTVLAGTGREDVTEPYVPIRDALAEHRETVPTRLFEADTTGQDTDGGGLQNLANRRRSLFYDVAQGLVDLAADQPIALFLDDLHAADPGTLALFESLADSLDDEPVLLIGSYRPEELEDDHPLRTLVTDLDDDVHLELDPLDEADTRTLIERTLDDRDVPQSFVDTVSARTGGHPLFVESTVGQLREQGIVDPRVGHYPDDPDLPLPREVRTVIERRLDALDDTARTVIETASVVGTAVDFRVLAAVTEMAATDLREYVDLLVATRIWTHEVDANDGAAIDAGDEAATDADVEDTTGAVVEAATGADDEAATGAGEAAAGGKFAFVNQVVNEAVREQLPDGRRRKFHEQVAEALEEVHDNELEAHAGTVARHYQRAGAPGPAIEYYRRAGDHAAAVYAHETAVDAYERALALAREHDRDETVLSLSKRIGEVHHSAGRYEEADRYFGYVLERTDDRSTYWEAAGLRALVRNKRGEYDEAIADVDRALDDWDGETATSEVRALLSRKVWSLYRKGEIERARDPAETQLELARQLDDPSGRGDALYTLATIEKDSGNTEEAIELLEDAIEAARAAGHKGIEALSRNELGVIYLRWDVQTALEIFEDFLRLHRERDTPWGQMVGTINVGECLRLLCEWDRALAHLEEAIELSRRLDAEAFVASATIKIGKVYLNRGELASAREHLDRGLARAEAVEYSLRVNDAHVALARLEYRMENLEAGEDHADEVLEPDESSQSHIVPEAYAAKGRLRLARDDIDGALSAHESGHERAIDTESPRSQVRNLCGLADAHRRAGRLKTAREKAEAACETAETQSSPLISVEAALALGRVQRDLAPERAEETLRAALDDARDLGTAVYECEALYELGRLHRARGDPRTARETFEAAVTLAEETGATLYERRSRSALEALRGGP